MRILNVSSLYPPNVVGGAEMGLKTISEAMVDLGHQLHVATLQPPKGIGKPVGDPSGKVEVHGFPLANIYWPFDQNLRPSPARVLWHSLDTENRMMAANVAKLVQRLQPDVVLTRNLQGFSTAVIPAVARLGVPVIHVLHDFSLVCPRTTMFKNGKECGMRSERCNGCRLLTPRRWRHTEALSGVIGVSRAVLDVHLDHGLFRNLPAKVIHNALRPEIKIADRAEVRKDGPLKLGFLGRVEQPKGIETLLKACHNLHRTGRAFELMVAGRGQEDYLRYLKARFPEVPVTYEGFVESASFLKALDVLVFPTECQEALGNGVFEAFSQGTLVIGSDRGGIPESIDHGTNGIVFPAGDVDALTSRLHQIFDNLQLRRALAQNALVKSRQYLAPNRARSYVEFVETVTDRATAAIA
ncbi:MAG: glycosyltransferase [Pseudomonadota bacterium]